MRPAAPGRPPISWARPPLPACSPCCSSPSPAFSCCCCGGGVTDGSGVLVLEGGIVGIEQERVGPGELADEGRMRDQAGIGLPQVQVITRRLHIEGRVVV